MSPRLTATVLSGSHSDILSKLRSDNAAATDLLHMQFGYYLYPPEFLLQLLELSRRKGWPLLITMHGPSGYEHASQHYPPKQNSAAGAQQLNETRLLQMWHVAGASKCARDAMSGSATAVGHSKNRPLCRCRCRDTVRTVPCVRCGSVTLDSCFPIRGLRELCLALGLLLPAFPDLASHNFVSPHLLVFPENMRPPSLIH